MGSWMAGEIVAERQHVAFYLFRGVSVGVEWMHLSGFLLAYFILWTHILVFRD
jgi:hypothetical protein